MMLNQGFCEAFIVVVLMGIAAIMRKRPSFPNRRTVSAFAQVHARTYNNARQIAVPTKGK
ncbi:TPA: hypothetical protein ACJL12_000798 [Neisseria meningitidis]|uniref:hypothetical protein n=1 Tax=Neisseria meningitidis TaxID=487 RepID=UPI001863F1B4|nr:hypothetical protein [Neisseria meningitidis]